MIQSASLSLAAEDPTEALTTLEQAVLDAGGFIVSASSWSSPGSPGYASLSARVPPEALAEVRRAALDLALQIQGDSMYGQDVTMEIRRLHGRLQSLVQAEDHVRRLIAEADDPQLAASLTVINDLVSLEVTNVRNQLADYESRSTLASLDVSFNSSAAMIAPPAMITPTAVITRP